MKKFTFSWSLFLFFSHSFGHAVVIGGSGVSGDLPQAGSEMVIENPSQDILIKNLKEKKVSRSRAPVVTEVPLTPPPSESSKGNPELSILIQYSQEQNNPSLFKALIGMFYATSVQYHSTHPLFNVVKRFYEVRYEKTDLSDDIRYMAYLELKKMGFVGGFHPKWKLILEAKYQSLVATLSENDRALWDSYREFAKLLVQESLNIYVRNNSQYNVTYKKNGSTPSSFEFDPSYLYRDVLVKYEQDGTVFLLKGVALIYSEDKTQEKVLTLVDDQLRSLRLNLDKGEILEFYLSLE